MLEGDNEEEIEMILRKTIKQKNAPSPLQRCTCAIVTILRSN